MDTNLPTQTPKQVFTRNEQWLIKAGTMAAWPFLTVFLIFIILAVMVPFWFVIPFSKFVKKDGKITAEMPWETETNAGNEREDQVA